MMRSLGICLAVVAVLFAAYIRNDADTRCRIVFMNIGQGDGIYIRTPGGDDIVIDTGPDLRVLHELGRKMPFYDHDIELLVMTHPHADHITGAVEFMRRYTVRQVVVSGKVFPSVQTDAFAAEVARWQTELTVGRAGQVWEFGGVRFDVLAPFDDAEVAADSPNDSSVVLRMMYGEHSFLFTGDAGFLVEERLLRRYGDGLRSEVLKVGHHGSKTSSSAAFLAAVAPDVAVIQSGVGNQFGHPHVATLDRLDAAGAQVLRNDEMGAIEMRCDEMSCTLMQ